MARRAGSAACLALVAATLAGCLDASVPSVAPTPTREPEPTPVTTTYELRLTAWYEGLALRFDTVTAVLDERGGLVTLALRLDNAGAEPATLNGRIRLVVDGRPIDPTRESKVPTVPAAGSAGAALTYELQGIASVDGAVIEVGDEPLHVVRVPLTPDAGPAALFEPVALELDGSATAGNLKVTLRDGLLRWDLPDWSQELDAGLAALTLTYDVTYVGEFAGGFAFTGENVALRLPDGTVVDPRRDGHSQSVELIGPHKTKKGLFSRFEIPFGVTGEFKLLIRSGDTEKSVTFTVEG